MTHVNAPPGPARLRMVLRLLDDGIPKAHVAAEFRVSRPTVATGSPVTLPVKPG